MSTKIYDGVKLLDVGTSRKLLEFQLNTRKTLLPLYQLEFKRLFFKALVYASMAHEGYPVNNDWMDWNAFKNKELDMFRYELSFAMKDVLKKADQAETLMDVDPDLLVCLRLGVFPLERQTLAIPFTYSHVIMNAFMELPNVVEYGYWDNVDRPEEVTRREWTQRRKTWDKALPGIGVPRECGMILTILGPEELRCNYYDLSDIDTDSILAETVAGETKRVIVNQLAEKFMEEHPGEQLRMSDLLDLDRQITEEEVQKKSSEIIEKVKAFIKKTEK